MVYGILVMVETDDKSAEAPTEKQVTDEIQSNLESTDWTRRGDVMWFEVHALTPKLRSRIGREQ